MVTTTACGRIDFETTAGAGAGGSGPPPLSSGDARLDVSGDGAADLVVLHSTSEGFLEVHTMAGAAPDADLPVVQLEGSSECGPRGAAIRASSPALGDAIIFGARCSADRNYAVSVQVATPPLPEGTTTYSASARGFSIGTNLPAIGSLVTGDLDDDRLLDLVVTIPDENLDPQVHVYFDIASSTSATPSLTLMPVAATDRLGAGAVVVDVTGDGIDDLVLGAPGSGGGAGVVYVLSGPLTPGTEVPVASLAAFTITASSTAQQLGTTLAVWDSDANDTPELAVAAPGDQAGSGSVFVLDLPTSGGSVSLANGRLSGATGERLGTFLDASGDVDADDARDLLVSASGAAANAGAVMVFRGRSGAAMRASSEADIRYVGNDPGAPWGNAVSIGDLDGDGRDDLAAACPSCGDGGEVTVHLTTDGLPTTGTSRQTAHWVLSPSSANGYAWIVPGR